MVLILWSQGRGFESHLRLLCTDANSACYPSLRGQLSWEVNGHTTWCPCPISMVLWLRLVSGWGLHETKVSATLWPTRLEKDFIYLCYRSPPASTPYMVCCLCCSVGLWTVAGDWTNHDSGGCRSDRVPRHCVGWTDQATCRHHYSGRHRGLLYSHLWGRPCFHTVVFLMMQSWSPSLLIW